MFRWFFQKVNIYQYWCCENPVYDLVWSIPWHQSMHFVNYCTSDIQIIYAMNWWHLWSNIVIVWTVLLILILFSICLVYVLALKLFCWYCVSPSVVYNTKHHNEKSRSNLLSAYHIQPILIWTCSEYVLI